MTKAQEIAFDHFCLEAEETQHPRFAHLRSMGGVPFSVVLTCNVGYE